MRKEQRLRKQLVDLQRQWELVSEKLAHLNKARILKTDEGELFRLNHEITELNGEREQLELQLTDVETKLATPQSRTACTNFSPIAPADNGCWPLE